MIYLAAPYNLQSTALERDGCTLYEMLAPCCFAADLAPGNPVKLVRGHVRAGRSKAEWIIARVHPFEMARGLFFRYDGELPADWSGFSVRLKPVRWERIGNSCFKLLEAKLRHIALLQHPERPAYPTTRTLTLQTLPPTH